MSGPNLPRKPHKTLDRPAADEEGLLVTPEMLVEVTPQLLSLLKAATKRLAFEEAAEFRERIKEPGAQQIYEIATR